MVYRILMLVEMLVMLKRVTNLLDLIEASEHKTQINSFLRMNLGKPSWACLSY